jgi:uncharacterized membrane protein
MEAKVWKVGLYATVAVFASLIYDISVQLLGPEYQFRLSNLFYLRVILAIVVLVIVILNKVPGKHRNPFEALFVCIILSELPVGFVDRYSPWIIIARTIALIFGAYAFWAFRNADPNRI